MSFKDVPISIISAPNYYSILPNNRWEVISPNAQNLSFQLRIVDGLGERPYVPASGSLMTVTFQRSNLIALSTVPTLPSNLTYTPRDVVKTPSQDPNNGSLYTIAMTTQDVTGIVSGSTLFTLVESGQSTTWLFDWSVFKKLTSPGF
jgi:hypothetical protein